ncbi:serine-rich coiled-coil domain-containing protein 2 isoform X3 [Carettochelys insculpta]|uniref:serine-rich coiled-coil domain-containing protein 2 isoform X3 n=1 Tax=Carettochelys insculpta TaxID=44489 RepID=UPI003EB951F7
MEEKNHIRTPFISKLPKYGTKSLGSTLQPVSKRTAVTLSGNPHSSSGKNCSKHNGSVCMSSFAFNLQKSNKYQLDDQNGRVSNSAQNSSGKVVNSGKYCPSLGGFGKDVLRVGLNTASSTASKRAEQVNMFVSSAEELNQKSSLGLSSSAKFTKGKLFGRTSYAGVSAPKSHLNGFYGNRSSLDLQRCRTNSSTTRTSSGESLTQSRDDVKSLSCEKMVRSQSFSHSIQNSFLPTASLTRSHSFNKAVDLTRPYQKQHLAIRASQRSILLSRNARQLDIPSGNEPLRYGFTRPYTDISGSKKPPLSNGSGAPPSLGYRMGRPSLLKPTRQQFTGKIIEHDNKSSATDMCTVKLSEITGNVNASIQKKGIENDSQRTECGEALLDDLGNHGSKVICTNDDVDEISISSLSSSEKNDLSEDFSDDFIDLEDANRAIQVKQEVLIKELVHGGTTPVDPITYLKESERPHCNTNEWLDIDVSVDNKNESTKHTIGNNLVSPDMDYRAGSSFELSPSDSSDGTYMWDEEGLEPIGSVHPCGSYESSEMNSVDILNNLDSCDLEDDDLMLDVDLPEDAPCDNVECENMNRYDRQDRSMRQHQDGFWKRTPQHWSVQDHYHFGHGDHFPHGKNDLSKGSSHLELPVGHFESYGAPNIYQSPRQLVGLPEKTVMLDEMTLRHMVQDCTAVKTQLLKLKRLLHQQNDENVSLQDIPLSIPSSPETQDVEPIYQTEDLLNEIRQLKEDIKKKDETIKRLEHQLASRCHCHKDGQKPKGMMCTYADKFTQTSCRRSSPQVLQPSSSLPSSKDLTQGKLIKTPLTEAHSEHPIQGLHENNDCHNQNAANGSLINSLNEVNISLRNHLKVVNKNAPFEENLKIKKRGKEPEELAHNEDSTLQSLLSPFQTPARADARDVQAKLAVKSQPSSTKQGSQPKTLRASEPPSQNALVPPTVAITAPSPTCSTASKEPDLPPSSSVTQLQPPPSQRNLKSKPSQRISKLRPPTVSFFKSKQISIPKSLLVSAEPLVCHSKTNIPRPLAHKKENVQNDYIGLHSGDSLPSNRHCRLPKPKTH